MSLLSHILMRAFGHPRGVIGKLGGFIMARSNRDCALWLSELLAPRASDRILEIGFGPGVAVGFLARRATLGYVAGVDASAEMVAQASARNAATIASGQVDLRLGSVERLPFPDASFDKALAINSMQLWPDAVSGLREIKRKLRPGGRIAMAFTPYAGQKGDGLTETLVAAGFTQAQLAERDGNFCGLALKPQL
jgi:SAM-dependent methyltransferase